jgi:hypothetical protein
MSSAKALDEQLEASQVDHPEQESGGRNDDDLLETELLPVAPSTPVPLFDYEEPPSPVSDENPLEPDVLPPDSSQAEPGPLPSPAITSSVEMPDPTPNPNNAELSEGIQRRSLGGWLVTAMKRGKRNRAPHQTALAESPQTSTPQMKTTPSNKQPSTMSPARRNRRTVMQKEKEASKPDPKPVTSNEPPKTTPHSKVGPPNAAADTKPEDSGVQHVTEQGPGEPSSYTFNVNCLVTVPSWICCGRRGHYGGTR